MTWWRWDKVDLNCLAFRFDFLNKKSKPSGLLHEGHFRESDLNQPASGVWVPVHLWVNPMFKYKWFYLSTMSSSRWQWTTKHLNRKYQKVVRHYYHTPTEPMHLFKGLRWVHLVVEKGEQATVSPSLLFQNLWMNPGQGSSPSCLLLTVTLAGVWERWMKGLHRASPPAGGSGAGLDDMTWMRVGHMVPWSQHTSTKRSLSWKPYCDSLRSTFTFLPIAAHCPINEWSSYHWRRLMPRLKGNVYFTLYLQW